MSNVCSGAMQRLEPVCLSIGYEEYTPEEERKLYSPFLANFDN